MRTAKIIRKGKHQFVMLPEEFHFDGNEALIKKNGSIVSLIPKRDSWRPFFRSLKMFSRDFMNERVQPELEKRDGMM